MEFLESIKIFILKLLNNETLVGVVIGGLIPYILFNLQQKAEYKRWENSSFVKRKQDVYIEYYNELLNIKENLAYIINEYFVYDTARPSDTVSTSDEQDEYINFDDLRINLSRKIEDILDAFKNYSVAFHNVNIYFKDQTVNQIDYSQLNHFQSNLGTMEAHILDLKFICIARKKEDKEQYYYEQNDFNWRLDKIRCSGNSILKALDKSKLIDYLEEVIVIKN